LNSLDFNFSHGKTEVPTNLIFIVKAWLKLQEYVFSEPVRFLSLETVVVKEMIARNECSVCQSAADAEKQCRGNGWNLLLTPLLPGTPATPGVVQKSSRRISRFEIIKHRIKRRNMSSATFARNVVVHPTNQPPTHPLSHRPRDGSI